jgi:hypothetical protein
LCFYLLSSAFSHFQLFINFPSTTTLRYPGMRFGCQLLL